MFIKYFKHDGALLRCCFSGIILQYDDMTDRRKTYSPYCHQSYVMLEFHVIFYKYAYMFLIKELEAICPFLTLLKQITYFTSHICQAIPYPSVVKPSIIQREGTCLNDDMQ